MEKRGIRDEVESGHGDYGAGTTTVGSGGVEGVEGAGQILRPQRVWAWRGVVVGGVGNLRGNKSTMRRTAEAAVERENEETEEGERERGPGR